MSSKKKSSGSDMAKKESQKQKQKSRVWKMCNETDDEETSQVKFEWRDKGNEVFLIGSFNKWQTKIPMTKDSQGVWRVRLLLK
jgi:1,4-alpha-glucan branching enzyme